MSVTKTRMFVVATSAAVTLTSSVPPLGSVGVPLRVPVASDPLPQVRAPVSSPEPPVTMGVMVVPVPELAQHFTLVTVSVAENGLRQLTGSSSVACNACAVPDPHIWISQTRVRARAGSNPPASILELGPFQIGTYPAWLVAGPSTSPEPAPAGP